MRILQMRKAKCSEVRYIVPLHRAGRLVGVLSGTPLRPQGEGLRLQQEVEAGLARLL